MVAVVLIGSLLLVHFSVRSKPLTRRPLDVDTGLPLPEVGQASTVFSLTALFGAYLGIYLLLGLPALAGVSVGTVGSLFAIRAWISQHGANTFEEFLTAVLDGSTRSGIAFAIMVSALQCAFAASELLILQEIGRVLFGLSQANASLFAVGAAVLGYFYVLFGGYLAVYRTDILQFGLVMAMVIGFSAYVIASHSFGTFTGTLLPRAGYWIPPLGSQWPVWPYIYQFVVGMIMGFGFLVAAPDAWKRVFVVATLRGPTLRRFLVFVGVGFLPFLALLPVVLSMPAVPDGPIDMNGIVRQFPAGDVLFAVGALGLLASFLSAFDSAMIASVQAGLILRRSQRVVSDETARYYWLMLTVLLTVFFLFRLFLSYGNPYLLASVLLGPYAIVAGIQAGSSARPSRLRDGSVLWLGVVAFVGWFMYLAGHDGFTRIPTTYQVNSVPVGAGLFIVIFVVCQVLSARKQMR